MKPEKQLTPQEALDLVKKFRRWLGTVIRWSFWLSAACFIASIWLWTFGWGGQFLWTGLLLLVPFGVCMGATPALDDLIKEAKRKLKMQEQANG